MNLDLAPPSLIGQAALPAADVPKPDLAQRLATDSTDALGNALLFAEGRRDELAFVPELGWMHFNGKYWQGRSTHAARLRAWQLIEQRQAAVTQAMGSTPGGEGKILELRDFRRKARIMEILDTAADYMRVGIAQFDAHPRLLNTASGVVDLKTGEVQPHIANLYLTQFTPVEYDQEAKSEVWEKTVLDAANGDSGLADYLQAIAGHACTGDVDAQRFFYFYGGGANGKSLLTNLWVEALGGVDGAGYAVRIQSETILGRRERDSAKPSPHLLALRGKRLALVAEPGNSSPINTARLKDLTGGDAITARAPYGRRNIDFQPSHTLIGCGNHYLAIDASDPGIWRRMTIVPFRKTFPPSRREEELRRPEQLTAILAWMVGGAVRLRREGWRTSAAVAGATAEYRAEMDPYHAWFEERCERNGAETPGSELYADFTAWCWERQGLVEKERHGLFTRRMRQLGVSMRHSNGVTLLGATLQPASKEPAPA